jgi:hypothetical protein
VDPDPGKKNYPQNSRSRIWITKKSPDPEITIMDLQI